MPSEFYDIDSIERYLTRQMTAGERAEFEALLGRDEGYRRELAAYQPLMDGFQALRSESFRRQLTAWEAASDTSRADEAEYIEWYLSGELQGEARARIDQKITEDEAFAREVAGYRQLHEGFEAARTETFLKKMQGWEKKKAEKPALQPDGRRPLWPRLAAAAAILLLLGFSFNWYVQSSFSNGALVQAYYQPALNGGTMGEEQDDKESVARQYEEAHLLFKQQDYSAAYQAFGTLLGQLPAATIDELSRSYYRQHAEWNRLLAALAMASPPLNIEEETRRIASAQGHAFQQPAEKLLRKLQSPLYRWAN